MMTITKPAPGARMWHRGRRQYGTVKPILCAPDTVYVLFDREGDVVEVSVGQLATPRQRLVEATATKTTEQLITAHRAAITAYWRAIDTGDKDNQTTFDVIINVIGEEFLTRDVPCTDCCFCPIEGGYHDARGCELTETPDTRAAIARIMDVIVDALEAFSTPGNEPPTGSGN